QSIPPSRPSDPPIHVAVVACGGEDRVEETIVNIKALVLFSTIRITFHVFADEELQPSFRDRIKKWPSYFRRQFTYTIYNITYPEDGQQENWRRLFKPCASQRLFLPSILQDVDSILYVDTDILFLSPVQEMWGEFDKFNSTQLSALSPEHEDPRVGWYSRFARHPYYGVTGVNSGVMLMNLTRIRNAEFKWQQMLLPLYVKYSLNLTWGDQDLLNIIFHYNPEMLRMMPCNKNYRPDHCMYMQMCASTAHEGVRVMHGCRRSFHIDKWPTFRSVYAAVRDF
uniref:UDP-D-xylose:beta-D-glucoside alpha-1,3-D-xylosyltransferase n=1 Tax=Ciona savignyi TaxID=51511 RepID=H2ZK09_CIOSA